MRDDSNGDTRQDERTSSLSTHCQPKELRADALWQQRPGTASGRERCAWSLSCKRAVASMLHRRAVIYIWRP